MLHEIVETICNPLARESSRAGHLVDDLHDVPPGTKRSLVRRSRVGGQAPGYFPNRRVASRRVPKNRGPFKVVANMMPTEGWDLGGQAT
jgi:hypothetical protein